MTRSSPIPPELRKWKYILLLRGGGAFFSDTLYRLIKQVGWSVWKRGKRWAD